MIDQPTMDFIKQLTLAGAAIVACVALFRQYTAIVNKNLADISAKLDYVVKGVDDMEVYVKLKPPSN